MTHSPEPWGCHDKGTEFPTICREYNENTCHEIAELTGCQGMTHEERVANGERIVACVNACQGIPTEDLDWVRIIDRKPDRDGFYLVCGQQESGPLLAFGAAWYTNEIWFKPTFGEADAITHWRGHPPAPRRLHDPL